MAKVKIELNENEWGQVLDGLEVRASAWEKTAEYLRTGDMSSELFLIEECSDAEEAEKIASDYRTIIEQVSDQLERGSGTTAIR